MSFSVDKALRQAKSHLKAGELAAAEELFRQVLFKFPKNQRAIQGYQKLQAGITSNGPLNSGPRQEDLDEMTSLYNMGRFEEVLSKVKPLIGLFPKAIFLFTLQGASNAALKRYDAAIENYKQAIKIKPDYVAAYFNMGIAQQDKGDLDAAIESYNDAIKIKRDHADAYNNMGIALKDRGDLDAAVQSSKKALKIKPDLTEAYLNIGNSLKEKGELEAAIESYKQALKLKPDYAEVYGNMAAALKDKGDSEAAIDSYKKAIKLKPDYADAYNKMGNTLQEQGKLEEAIEAYNKTLVLKPDFAEAYNNMGNTLQDQGKLEEAIEAYGKALAIKPDYANAYYNMGAALQDQGKLEEATEAYNKVLAIHPDYADAYYNMGNTLKDQGKLEEAIEAYSKALALKPDYAEAHNNMGNTFKDQGKLEEAIEAYNKTLALKPDYAEAYNNIGNTLQGQGKLEEAIEAYNKTLALKPDYAVAYYNMGAALKDQGKLEGAIEAYNKAIALKPDYADALSQAYSVGSSMSDWAYISTLENRLLAGKLVGKQSVYGLLALADRPSMHLEKTIGLTLEKYKNTSKFATKPFQKSKRIKLGYFSSYFRLHPVSILSTQMLEYTNREQFELFAFHYGPDSDDPYNLRLRDTFDHFINVSKMTDKEIAELAYQKGIDIAIEFNGFMIDERVGILAHRPAPVQINYLAYPGTMGADFYDYIIGDHVVIPEDQKHNYAENIIYLPDCYMPHDNTRQISNKPISRAECGLPDNRFVFCCFNNSFKISPQEFDIWMRLLNKIEGSVLWLLKANEWSQNNLRNEASKRGVDADRLVFADKLPLEEHLGRLRHADLFLDTFNFNAHTTASDALWAGIPVVTKIGKSFAARVAGSLLNAIELPELITTTEKEYEALALSLASNPKTLTLIKKKLAEKKNSAPLFDTETYTKNLERAYIQAYQRYADGLPPAELNVL